MMPAINNQDLLPFQFEGMRLQEACFINGNPYFTAKTIGEFLEYRDKRPEKSINHIIDRNPHILTFATDAKLTSVEGRRTVTRNIRVFDPIGLQLIINKSNQPKAIAFQIAVANLVLAFMKGNIKPKIWEVDRVSAIKQILSHPPTYKRTELVRDLAGRENVSLATVYRWIEKFGGIKTRKGKKKERSLKAA